VFPDGTTAGADALVVAALVDPAFLAGAGWDRDRQVLHLTPEHPQFGWKACLFPRCPARRRVGGFCQACHGWLTTAGIDVTAGDLDLAALPARPPLFREGACAVLREAIKRARVEVLEKISERTRGAPPAATGEPSALIGDEPAYAPVAEP
jgi:hypothetical protein